MDADLRLSSTPPSIAWSETRPKSQWPGTIVVLMECPLAVHHEQLAYYRAVANEYEDHEIDVPGQDELLSAIDAFRPTAGPRPATSFGLSPGACWIPEVMSE
jgi:hypothetical protein